MSYKKRNFFERIAFAITDSEKLTSPYLIKSAFDDLQKIKQLNQKIAARDEPNSRKQLEQQKRMIELGIQGEQSVLFELENAFLPIHIIHDLRISHNDLKAQLDFVVITRKFILVIEVKNYYGDIEITDNDEFVRKVQKNNKTIFKEGFYSPIRQIQRQVNVLEALLKDNQVINKMPIKYVVVFSNKRTILNTKKANPQVRSKILRADQLVHYLTNELKQESPTHLLDKHMTEMGQYIKSQHQSQAFDTIEKSEEKLLEETISMQDEEPKLVNPLQHNTTHIHDSEELAEALRTFRKELSVKKNVKAFYIFSNKTLDELVAQRPLKPADLLEISGIGELKHQEFGHELIEVIRRYSNHSLK
ncbi:MAG: NERD domain-containing protein [Lysinibacillus sp.]